MLIFCFLFQVDLWFSIIFFILFTVNAFCEPFWLAHHNPLGCALGSLFALPAITMSINMRWYALLSRALSVYSVYRNFLMCIHPF